MNTGNVIQNTMKLVLGLACAATVLAGCAESGGRTPSPAPQAQTPTLPGGLTADINYITFSLPEQVRWVQNQAAALEEAGVAEWYVEGTTPQTSPARVMYQKLMPAQTSNAVRAQILKPLENCFDSKVSGFRTSSKYGRQLSFEAVCSKFGEANFGLINFVSIFTDGAANHLVLTEVRMPASQKVGELRPKTAAERQWVETSRRLTDLMRNTMQTIRACDANDQCI